jgi:hypothetical protein
MIVHICIGRTQIIGGKCHIIHLIYTKSAQLFQPTVLDPNISKLLQQYEMVKFTTQFKMEEKQFSELQPFLTTPTSSHDFLDFDECLQKLKQYVPPHEFNKFNTSNCLEFYEIDRLNLTNARMIKCFDIMINCYNRNNIAADLRFTTTTDINLLTIVCVVCCKEVKNAIRIVAQGDVIDYTNEIVLTNFVSEIPSDEIKQNIKDCFQITTASIKGTIYMIVDNEFFQTVSKKFVTIEEMTRMFLDRFEQKFKKQLGLSEIPKFNRNSQNYSRLQPIENGLSSYRKIPANRKSHANTSPILLEETTQNSLAAQTTAVSADVPNA